MSKFDKICDRIQKTASLCYLFFMATYSFSIFSQNPDNWFPFIIGSVHALALSFIMVIKWEK